MGDRFNCISNLFNSHNPTGLIIHFAKILITVVIFIEPHIEFLFTKVVVCKCRRINNYNLDIHIFDDNALPARI